MVDNLIETLETLGYPVFRQGSLTEDEPYPATFITFWNNESPDHAYYDNNDYGTAWAFSVYVYSTDNALTYSVLMDARTALRAAGWIVPGKGYDVASDEITHTGRGVEIYYLEVEKFVPPTPKTVLVDSDNKKIITNDNYNVEL